MTFYISGKLAEAIDHLTEAIVLNPTSAILYSTRGIFLNEIYWIHSGYLLCPIFQALSHHLFHSLGNFTFMFSAGVFVKLSKPNAAIRDADTALEVG